MAIRFEAEAMPADGDHDAFEGKLRQYPNAYFWCVLENVKFANQARYEMQRLFVYEGRDLEDFFRRLTEFLSFAANVSRVFWYEGGTKIEKERAQLRTRILRELIGISEEHPLSKREWRNHLAHYESRIDDWLATSVNMNIARRIVGPIGRVIAGLNEHEIFEQYDPTNHVFYFRGAKYPINEIQSDINEIATLIHRSGLAR